MSASAPAFDPGTSRLLTVFLVEELSSRVHTFLFIATRFHAFYMLEFGTEVTVLPVVLGDLIHAQATNASGFDMFPSSSARNFPPSHQTVRGGHSSSDRAFLGLKNPPCSRGKICSSSQPQEQGSCNDRSTSR